MNKYSDSVIATNLLRIRKAGYPLWKYLLVYLVKYLFFLVPAFIVLWLVKCDIPFFTLLFGLIVGALARDLGWLIYAKKTWPFQEKVIDWQKVEQFADSSVDTK